MDLFKLIEVVSSEDERNERLQRKKQFDDVKFDGMEKVEDEDESEDMEKIQEDGDEEGKKWLKKKRLSESVKAKKMRELRKRRAIKAGREPGVAGRPKAISAECSSIIESKIKEDAEKGIFHDVKWVQELVCCGFFF
jgi:hypothetical protein